MNKELIKKYFTEFNHWLENGDILYKHKNSSAWWDTYCWNYSSDYVIAVIINDKFVEIRKAIAEGKTVQYNFGNFGPNKQDFPDVWRELDLSIGIKADRAAPENYRIKPELDIRVGDWVILNDQYYKVRQTEPQWEYVYTEDGRQIWNSLLSVWKPKPAEWCIMDTTTNDQAYSFTVQKWQADSKWTPAPYTGPLPYFIKEH